MSLTPVTFWSTFLTLWYISFGGINGPISYYAIVQGPLNPDLLNFCFLELDNGLSHGSFQIFDHFYVSFFQAQSFRMDTEIFPSVARLRVTSNFKNQSHFPHSNRIFFDVGPTIVQDLEYFFRQDHWSTVNIYKQDDWFFFFFQKFSSSYHNNFGHIYFWVFEVVQFFLSSFKIWGS